MVRVIDLNDTTFDAVVLAALSSLGVSGAVIFLASAAFWLASWQSGLSLSFRIARGVGRTASAAARAEPMRGPISVIATVGALCAQLLTVVLCFLTGNYVAIALSQDRQDQIKIASQGTSGEIPRTFADVTSFDWFPTLESLVRSALRADPISLGFSGAAIFILFWSYRLARSGAEFNWLSFFLALPWSLVFYAALAGGAIAGAIFLLGLAIQILAIGAGAEGSVRGYVEEQLYNVAPLIAALAGCGIYLYACDVSLRMSGVVVRMWRSGR